MTPISETRKRRYETDFASATPDIEELTNCWQHLLDYSGSMETDFEIKLCNEFLGKTLCFVRKPSSRVDNEEFENMTNAMTKAFKESQKVMRSKKVGDKQQEAFLDHYTEILTSIITLKSK